MGSIEFNTTLVPRGPAAAVVLDEEQVADLTAVAVQGDPDHPVNRGRLCPKGLTEHHTLRAEGRLH